MEERRKHQRHRTLKSGKIIFNNKSCVVDCTIRNLSGKGAFLTVSSTVGIPESFELLIQPDGLIQTCRIIRKASNGFGVAFQ